MANHPTTYYVGLDLGQSQDYTALAVIQKVPTYDKQTGKTGVGVAVTDLLKERRLNYIAVTITGMGQKVNRTGMREYSVPKQDLVSALEVPFHKGTLKVAKGLEGWPKLREELLNFRRKQNKVTAHISYEHWRESDHDDLVLAAALACWKATYKRKGSTKFRIKYLR
jgi:hypothetical protein